jgi:hypothetical protein
VNFASGILAITALTAQHIYLEPAERVNMPGTVDSNSPAHWMGDLFYLFNSEASPVRSQGPDQFNMGRTRAVLFDTYDRPHRWIESTWVAPNGWIYAWYHHEPGLVCGDRPLTAPMIGALVSFNNGAGFFDLGVVLESGYPLSCDTPNLYFAGGHGDFSVIADEEGKYFYFFFGNYSGPAESQGIAVARMAIEDRDEPVGRVFKYHNGAWEEPGLYGEVTPILPAVRPWEDPFTDSFWGPSLHYNTALNRHVMLLSRSCCEAGWPQEGVYVSTSANLASPDSWSVPEKLVDVGGWYPQVLGLGPGETDKRAGSQVRFYMGGESDWILRFDGAPALDPAIPAARRKLDGLVRR